MIYRIHFCDEDGSDGYGFFASVREAMAAKVEYEETHEETDCDFDAAEIPKNKKALVQLLRDWAAHNDNG